MVKRLMPSENKSLQSLQNSTVQYLLELAHTFSQALFATNIFLISQAIETWQFSNKIGIVTFPFFRTAEPITAVRMGFIGVW